MDSKALEILRAIVPRCKCDYSRDLKDFQRAYCYRQLAFIERIAADALASPETNGGYATSILCRSLLESLFRLGGAADSEETCLRIVFTDASEDLKRTKFFRDVDPNPPAETAGIIQELENELVVLQALTTIQLKKIDLYTATPSGGLKNLYRASYHSLSQITHANYTTIDLCSKGKILAGDVRSSVTLFVCLAARIGSVFFELADRDEIWASLRALHPDLQQTKSE